MRMSFGILRGHVCPKKVTYVANVAQVTVWRFERVGCAVGAARSEMVSNVMAERRGFEPRVRAKTRTTA